MKAIFFMFLLCCICCLSCSDEQNTKREEQNVIENKTFEKVSSLELKQQLLDYLNNSVKTRTTFNNAEMNYDLGMQEILRPQIQTFGEEMIVVRSKMDANNIMAFYKENGVIENCLIIECAQNAEDALEETMFTCYDSNNIPIFKAMVNKRNNTCNVLEIYDGLDDLTARGGNWGCNVSLGLAGALWSTAFGMVTAGAGFVVAVGWCVLQTWLCSSRVVSRPPTEIQIDTIEFKPMERDDDSIARDTIGKLLPLR